MKYSDFDLLSTVEYGGCSAKIPQEKLTALLSALPLQQHPDILVDRSTHDDAGVFKINDTTALIFTTDFFPPVCSDAYMFGQIAAANSLSDVYAMGGKPLLALNLVMFPATEIPLEVLGEILRGGNDKITEAGAITMGGHTIDDNPPKYGLAVVGTTNPNTLITNAKAQAGQLLILTKPLGTGVAIAAKRVGICDEESYNIALENMAQLNAIGADIMQEFGVGGATDVTGFGLLGHLTKMSEASGVSFTLSAESLPTISGVEELVDQGCIPGAALRNLRSCEATTRISPEVSMVKKILACDAQTSGGLLMAINPERAGEALTRLQATYPQATIIGSVTERRDFLIELV